MNYRIYETSKGTFYAYVQDVKIEFEQFGDYCLPIIDKFITQIKQTKDTRCMDIENNMVSFYDFENDKTYLFEIVKRQKNKFKHLFFMSVVS